MSFAKCPSCEKIVFVSASKECPNCGVMLQAEELPIPQASGDNEKMEYPQRSRLSCIVAGIAAAIILMAGMVMIIAMADK